MGYLAVVQKICTSKLTIHCKRLPFPCLAHDSFGTTKEQESQATSGKERGIHPLFTESHHVVQTASCLCCCVMQPAQDVHGHQWQKVTRKSGHCNAALPIVTKAWSKEEGRRPGYERQLLSSFMFELVSLHVPLNQWRPASSAGFSFMSSTS